MTTRLSSSPTPPSPPPGTRRRQTIATLLGEPTFERINWQHLMQEGVLVQLSIRRCGFTTRLDLSDLGIEVEESAARDKLARWLVLGTKRLLPETYMKALARLESSARYALKERSFRTELGAFVPASAYRAWRDQTEQFRTQYFELRDEILNNHHSLVQQVLSEYEVIARDTYLRVRRSHPELLQEGQDAFITAYCQRIAQAIPSPARIRDTFDFGYRLIDGLSHVGTTPRERLASPNTSELASDTVSSPPAELRTQMEQHTWDRATMERDLRRQAQERVQAVLDSYLGSIVGQLRTLTYDVMCDVLTTLQRRGDERFSPRSVVQLTHLLETVGALNFYGDHDLEQMMRQLQEIVDQSPTQRAQALGEIQRTLRAIATVTRATLLDLEEEPRSARELAIPDIPTERNVRQARAELGLLTEEEAMPLLARETGTEPRAFRAEMERYQMDTLWTPQELAPSRMLRDL